MVAQDASCPCENCPEPIRDVTITHEFRLNIFNVQNNDLASPDQCVSKVGVTFKHTYLGDVEMELESPDGDIVKLIGPVTFSLGSSGQTDQTTFDVGFVPSNVVPEPEGNFFTEWDNEQEWALFGGTRRGTYHPFRGDLRDFDSGRVNGTWILRVKDQISPDPSIPNEKTDEGEFLDFYVEFCDDEGLVCDPCLDPEDDPICTFKVDAAEQIVVPSESFCLPIYAENVAFLRDMQFSMNWDASLLQYTGVDSFKIEFLEESDFNIADVGNGNLSIAYNHTFDNLGLVVADSTPIFQVCFNTLGNVGDSTQITFPSLPVAIDVDGMAMPVATIDGQVKISVDSTADCIRAIQVCDNSPIEVEKSRGPGFERNEGGDCFPQNEEHQAKWYKFDIIESGDLEFIIRPKGEASYGFTLFKGGCPNSADSEQISCETGFPLLSRPIGMADNAQTSFGEIDQASFKSTTSAVETETYYLLVDNFSNNGVGFDLEFGGTAKIGDYTLQAQIADPAIINCYQPTIQLDATESTQGTGYFATWSTDTGQINTTPGLYEPLILEGGTFTLEITDSRTGCVSKDSVLVLTDQEDPISEAGDGGTVDCTSPTLRLSSAGSSQGDQFEISWSTTDGVIDNDPSLESVFVSAGGTYEVAITNSDNGCSTNDEVFVDSEFDNPHLETSDAAISCFNPTVDLVAVSNTPEVTYNWIVFNLTTPITDSVYIANDTGNYVVKVTAPNGCTTFDTIFVKEERVFPIAEAGDSLTLNCRNPVLTLSGAGSSENAPFTYQWSTEDGRFVENTDLTSLTPQIDTSAWYKLAITNNDNGCVSVDSVFIDSSFIKPIALLAADTLLNCYNPILTIDASASDSGAIYDFSWFVVEGNIIADEDTYHPKVDMAGGYFFNIENTENGCVTTSDIVTINPDTIRPNADAGAEQTLNCTQPVLFLDGSASSTGVEFSYQWTTEDGNILSMDNTTVPEVDSAGLYTLKVTDDSNGCESFDSVSIPKDFVIPDLQIPNDSTLTCLVPSILLEAISLTPNTNFTWIDPNEESVENASINTQNSGEFTAIVTAENGCTNTKNLLIDVKQEFPKIAFQDPEIITCDNNIITLNAENSDNTNDFEPFWSTENGQFVNAEEQNSLIPEIDLGGTYFLEITNSQTGCTSIDSISVIDDREPPEIDFLNIPDTLTCSNKSVSVTATSNVSNALFQWKFEQDLLSETAELTVDKPGNYNILVTNPANNCSFRSTISIFNDTIMPIADAGPSLELNCAIGQVVLDGNNSSKGEAFQYLWTAQGSESISDSLNVPVTKTGLYTFIVLNRTNGCRTIDTVRVTESRDNPIADAGKDTIFCRGVEDLEIVLGGANTSIGANYSYEWRDLNNNQLGVGKEQLVFVADTFLLEVRNNDNNCVTTDTVEVIEKNAPKIEFITSGGINCQQNELIYTVTSDAPVSTIHWEGMDFFSEDSVLVLTDELTGESFIAVVVDELSGCISNQSIVVQPDRLPPIVDAGKDVKLNCKDTLFLDGKILSQNLNPVINWRTETGNFVTEIDSLNPIVDAAGVYILNIENKDNFCQAEDTVVVINDQIFPIVLFEKDTLLTCYDPLIDLEPDSLSRGDNFYYEWRDSDRKILGTNPNLAVSFPDVYEFRVIDSTNLCRQVATIEVFDSLKPPLINIEEPEILTCANEVIELTAQVGVEQGSFAWSFASEKGSIISDTSQTVIQVDSAGVYQIEATNLVSGCSSLKSIEVFDIRAPILIEAGENQTITCYNDTSVVLTGTIFSENENLIYEWTTSDPGFDPIDSSLILNITNPGTFFFTVTDTLSACETIDTLVVDENTQAIAIDLIKEATLDCENTELVLGDERVNTTEDIRFAWNTEAGNIIEGENESTVLVDQEGVYLVDVINTLNGCTFADSVRVFNNQTVPTVEAGANQTITCIEKELVLGSENTSIGNQFQYTWTTEDGFILEGLNTPYATVNQTGTYELMVLDTTNHCTEKATVLIAEDTAEPELILPNGLTFLCTNETIVINPTTSNDLADLEFQWFTNDGIIVSDTNQLQIEVETPAEYFVKVTNKINGCETANSLIIADSRTLPEVANLEDRMLGCNNEPITISAIGSATGEQIGYEWLNINGTPLSNNTTLIVSEPGDYILKVINTENSCFNQDTINITENIDPPTSAVFNLEMPTCNGEDNGIIEVTEVIGGTAPYIYQLNENEEVRDPQFRDLASNSYQLTITDELTCQWDTLIQLNQPDALEAQLLVSDDDIVTNELATFTITSNIPEEEIAEVIWSPEEIFDCLNCTEQTTSFLNNTTIEVTIIDVNDCAITTSLEVEVSLAEVPNAISPNGDGKNDVFIVPAIEADPTGFPESELIIFNRWNNILYQSSPYNNDWDGTTNGGKPLPHGTYYYVLRLNVKEGETMKGEITIIGRR